MVIPAIPRLGSGVEVDLKEFQTFCISLAKEIDAATGKSEVPSDVQELTSFLTQVCRLRCDDDQTRAAMMLLMVSVKSACQLGWFPDQETQELLALADLISNGFSTPGNVIPSIDSSFSLFSQVLERFYPSVKLGHIVVSFEAKPTSNIIVKDFHISKKMAHNMKQRVGLFVVRTEDVSKSSCLIHPQEVSFLLNGKGVEKRVKISMDSGPQLPTNVTAMLNPGANLLQTIGCFGGSYFIVIAFMDVTLPEKPLLKDYVHSEVIESNSDCDIIEGASRISLSCPISRTRIKLPVKGHVCKHLQCFDFWNYVKINIRRPSWRCPHCNQSVCYTDIRVDQKMVKILGEVECNASDVIISADGPWRVVTENDENVELVRETTQDPSSCFQNLGPTVLDLTGDENEMETSGGTKVYEQKPCLSEIQGMSNNTHNPATDYTMRQQFSASINNELPELPQTFNSFNGQQYMNLPQVPNTGDSIARQASHVTFVPPQDRLATNTRNSVARQASPMTYLPPQDRLPTNTARLRTSIPAPQPSQFQGSHAQPSHFQGPRAQSYQFQGSQAQSYQFQGSQVTSLESCLGRTSDLIERWNNLYGNGINQTQMPPMPPLQHHYATENQRLPNRNLSHAQQRPIPSSITNPQTVAVNYGGTTNQRHMPRPNLGAAVEQFSSPELMNLDSANWRPQSRMRGSIMPGSTAYDQMIIRPTQHVQAQSQTIPQPQPIAYNNNSMADEIQSFLAHPSYPIGFNEAQGGMGSNSMPVAEGLGATPGSFWSMPPEKW